jgi:CHRD domain
MPYVLRGLAGAMLGAIMLIAVPTADAQTVALKAELSGANQVPPLQVPGKGNVVASFDSATKTLKWTITFSGLTGPAFAMHFHGPADQGRNAGIALPITGNLNSPIDGSAALSDRFVTDLLAGRWYLNIHTAAHPAGELRGQLLMDAR